MGRKKKNSQTQFDCKAREATAVFLAGTFNDWNTETMPMTRDDEGDWHLSLDLAPGQYEFKFFVDGKWCCAPGCDGRNYECPMCVVNEHGTMNRVIEVESR